jgi:hypothetical protein
MYLSTHFDESPKVWNSLSDFLKSEFNAHLNKERKIVLDLPQIYVDKKFVSSMSFGKDYTEEQAILSFAYSTYFYETMNSLHYKVYRVSPMW